MDLKSHLRDSQPHHRIDRLAIEPAIMEPSFLSRAGNTVGAGHRATAGMRYWATVSFRVLSLLGVALWVGGFTFYSAVVIPALDDALGSVDAGFITQGVTNTLNAIGVAALVACSIWMSLELPTSGRLVRRLRMALVLISALILAFLILWHRRMDQHLDTIGLSGFYRLHRVYLIASTMQWLANLGLLALFGLSKR